MPSIPSAIIRLSNGSFDSIFKSLRFKSTRNSKYSRAHGSEKKSTCLAENLARFIDEDHFFRNNELYCAAVTDEIVHTKLAHIFLLAIVYAFPN